MSRDKKKEANPEKKKPSDYQSGKGKATKEEVELFSKKGKNGK